MNLRQAIITLICGVLFGFGLAVSTMISPEVILSFLTGRDFGLLLVMGGGVFITLLAYQFVPHWMKRPVFAESFRVRESVLNRNTVVGSALFGVGWGMCGVCPGPAIAGLGAGNWMLGYALLGMIIGAYVQGRTAKLAAIQ
ncbi:MAG TPA: DUF6691 family protein [Steroidobacteraceae bacterium]|nr:DUF6691 family protein [Steroidobacteraceae bacterium]